MAVMVAGAAAAGGALWVERQLPEEGMVARGVLVGELTADGATPARDLARAAAAPLDRPLRIRLGDRPVAETSLRALGAALDEDALARNLERIGRDGDLWQRLDDASQAAAGKRRVAAPIHLPVERLEEALRGLKEIHDSRPRPARWSFAEKRATDHRDGELVDVYRTAERLLAAALDSDADGEVELAIHRVSPRATSEAVAAIDRSEVLSRYESHFAFTGNQAGRAQNIARAAAGIDGLVLMPDEVISFNESVGPRSIENGFAEAGEIYKGEMRMGIGGGTCQVSSTLHASAFFAGIEMVERSPHSRPIGYIPIGLDATVVYPAVDFKLRNPFSFPIVVHARAEKGTLVVELLGRERPAQVQLATSTVGMKRFTRKITKAPYLEEGRIVRKQPGRRGVVIEKQRRIEYADGRRRTETTRDVYPPTQEIYLLGPGVEESDLPPLPSDV